MAKIATLTDDFTTADTGKWLGFNADITATGGELVVQCLATWPEIDSQVAYDLSSSSIFAKVTRAAQGDGGTYTVWGAEVSQWDQGRGVYFQVRGANLEMIEANGGAPSTTSITYNATDHAWMRIRNSGNTLYWDTSPDGLTWTQRRSKTRAVTITSMYVFFTSYYTGANPSSAARFDNVNLVPAAAPPPNGAGFFPFLFHQSGGSISESAAVVPYSDPEILNAARGQFQGHSDKPLQVGATQVRDAGDRFAWKTIQPSSSGSYTWTAIDNAISAAAAAGRRYHFRVMAFNSYQHLLDGGTSTAQSVPSWLRSTSGATTDRSKSGVTYVIPNWDNNAYLTAVENLIAAIGARYDSDERVEWVEFSGYGDFSENHVTFMRDDLSLPGVAPGSSVATLGYYSQYQDQYITKASITRLVNAHLSAFQKTRIITTTDNPEVTRQLMSASPAKPAGFRGDALGAYDPRNDWATNQYSWYVENSDPFLAVLNARWQTAPVVTEFANWYPTNAADLHSKALSDTVNVHVSMVSNNIEITPTGTDLARLVRTYKYAGYRYTAQGGAPSGGSLPVTWTNWGVAPAYDAWAVYYDFRDSGGTVVKTVTSALDLTTLAAAQSYSDLNADPATASTVDTVPLTGLAAGTYAVWARVEWAEHKTGGTNTWTEAPMALAMTDRGPDGGYRIGTVTL